MQEKLKEMKEKQLNNYTHCYGQRAHIGRDGGKRVLIWEGPSDGVTSINAANA